MAERHQQDLAALPPLPIPGYAETPADAAPESVGASSMDAWMLYQIGIVTHTEMVAGGTDTSVPASSQPDTSVFAVPAPLQLDTTLLELTSAMPHLAAPGLPAIDYDTTAVQVGLKSLVELFMKYIPGIHSDRAFEFVWELNPVIVSEPPPSAKRAGEAAAAPRLPPAKRSKKAAASANPQQQQPPPPQLDLRYRYSEADNTIMISGDLAATLGQSAAMIAQSRDTNYDILMQNIAAAAAAGPMPVVPGSVYAEPAFVLFRLAGIAGFDPQTLLKISVSQSRGRLEITPSLYRCVHRVTHFSAAATGRPIKYVWLYRNYSDPVGSPSLHKENEFGLAAYSLKSARDAVPVVTTPATNLVCSPLFHRSSADIYGNTVAFFSEMTAGKFALLRWDRSSIGCSMQLHLGAQKTYSIDCMQPFYMPVQVHAANAYPDDKALFAVFDFELGAAGAQEQGQAGSVLRRLYVLIYALSSDLTTKFRVSVDVSQPAVVLCNTFVEAVTCLFSA